MAAGGRVWDAAVVGGGPAGLAAGAHLARAGLKAALVERDLIGGQARCIERLENYPGFPRGVAGGALMDRCAAQASRWGLAFRKGEVVSVALRPDGTFSLGLRSGGGLAARSVIWCAGAGFRSLGAPGEKKFAGRGVWNTADEAPDLGGLTVGVAGSGEAALQQAALLARRARRVYLITRGGELKGHRLLKERFRASGALWLPGFTVRRLTGGKKLEAAELLAASGENLVLPLDALFVLAGKEPRPVPAGWRRPPAGFFSAGDAASGIFRQVAVACGDGVRAAMRCMIYLEGGRWT